MARDNFLFKLLHERLKNVLITFFGKVKKLVPTLEELQIFYSFISIKKGI